MCRTHRAYCRYYRSISGILGACSLGTLRNIGCNRQKCSTYSADQPLLHHRISSLSLPRRITYAMRQTSWVLWLSGVTDIEVLLLLCTRIPESKD
ncbi:hypothetical protein Y032_0203g1836 [Ancylostoma ceylanicum]|uniref:Uncharacterized protein n=1 Tax=Ancylostoma ceylanicum TaxID=53326 RepID=A0A016SM47_9BILA|nr:hypothetical protein Y032_0203g1836 [Ancylostoma ceylanicum]